MLTATKVFGWDRHVWDMTPDQIINGRKVSIACQSLFIAAAGLAKLSILLSYLRIAPERSWFRRFTWVSMLPVFLVCLTSLAAEWLQCM